MPSSLYICHEHGFPSDYFCLKKKVFVTFTVCNYFQINIFVVNKEYFFIYYNYKLHCNQQCAKGSHTRKKSHEIELAHTLPLHENFYGYHEYQEQVLHSQPQHHKIVLWHSWSKVKLHPNSIQRFFFGDFGNQSNILYLKKYAYLCFFFIYKLLTKTLNCSSNSFLFKFASRRSTDLGSHVV